MEIKKLLLLLTMLTILVNYNNYYKDNRVVKEIALLKKRIKTQKAVSKDMNLSVIKEEIVRLQNYQKLLMPKNMNFSKAMGELQGIIEDSAKDLCKINNTKWATYFKTKMWYEILKIDVTMVCSPKKLTLFINRLKKAKYLIRIKTLFIRRAKNNVVAIMRIESYKAKS